MTEPIGTKPKKKTGRKPLPIDENIVFELAKIHCSQKEIAIICKCSVDTIDRRFADAFKRGDEEGKMSLKRKMFKMAEAGNCAMLIWLSKQRLGYRDKSPEEVGSVSFNVTINEVPK